MMIRLKRWKAARTLFERSRVSRFLVVGFGNTLFGYGLFAGLFYATGSHRLSIIVATVLGVLFNFFTTGRIVFHNQNSWAILPFMLGYAAALALNLVLLDGLVIFGVNPLLAQAVCLPCVVVVSYIINARIVFQQRPR